MSDLKTLREEAGEYSNIPDDWNITVNAGSYRALISCAEALSFVLRTLAAQLNKEMFDQMEVVKEAREALAALERAP